MFGIISAVLLFVVAFHFIRRDKRLGRGMTMSRQWAANELLQHEVEENRKMGIGR